MASRPASVLGLMDVSQTVSYLLACGTSGSLYAYLTASRQTPVPYLLSLELALGRRRRRLRRR